VFIQRMRERLEHRRAPPVAVPSGGHPDDYDVELSAALALSRAQAAREASERSAGTPSTPKTPARAVGERSGPGSPPGTPATPAGLAQAARFWLGGCIDFAEPIRDGFYDVWSASALEGEEDLAEAETAEESAQLPSLEALFHQSPRRGWVREAILVDGASDESLRELEGIAQAVSESSAEGAADPHAARVRALARLVGERMDGAGGSRAGLTREDLRLLSSSAATGGRLRLQQVKWRRERRRLQNEVGCVVVRLGELEGGGTARHRALLFKVLCDRVRPRIPCRLLRGAFYCGGRDDSAIALVLAADGVTERAVHLVSESYGALHDPQDTEAIFAFFELPGGGAGGGAGPRDVEEALRLATHRTAGEAGCSEEAAARALGLVDWAKAHEEGRAGVAEDRAVCVCKVAMATGQPVREAFYYSKLNEWDVDRVLDAAREAEELKRHAREAEREAQEAARARRMKNEMRKKREEVEARMQSRRAREEEDRRVMAERWAASAEKKRAAATAAAAAAAASSSRPSAPRAGGVPGAAADRPGATYRRAPQAASAPGPVPAQGKGAGGHAESSESARIQELRSRTRTMEEEEEEKARLRVRAVAHLGRVVGPRDDLVAALRKLGVDVGHGSASAAQVRKATQRAMLKFHPDRQRLGPDRTLWDVVLAEETFKVITLKMEEFHR